MTMNSREAKDFLVQEIMPQALSVLEKIESYANLKED